MAIDINELIAEVVKHSHFDGETIELGNLISLHINEEGTKYNPILSFRILREDKIEEIREFFNEYGIKYRTIGE